MTKSLKGFGAVAEHAEDKAFGVLLNGACRNYEGGTVERLLVEDIIVDTKLFGGNLHPHYAQTGASPESKRINHPKSHWQRHLTQGSTAVERLVANLLHLVGHHHLGDMAAMGKCLAAKGPHMAPLPLVVGHAVGQNDTPCSQRVDGTTSVLAIAYETTVTELGMAAESHLHHATVTADRVEKQSSQVIAGKLILSKRRQR